MPMQEMCEYEFWKNCVLRVHLLQNVCDSLLNTILGMDKSKGTDNARKDLADMKIRPE